MSVIIKLGLYFQKKKCTRKQGIILSPRRDIYKLQGQKTVWEYIESRC